jgi:hypothetical protein
LERVGAVHIAGGKWIVAPDGGDGSPRTGGEGGRRARRLLDDHKHDVPDPVYELLEELGARTDRPLTVILEQDGDYPPMAHLLAQLDRARAALVRGRTRRAATVGGFLPEPSGNRKGAVSAADSAGSPAFEGFLARLYADDTLRGRFLCDPIGATAGARLSQAQVGALRDLDRTGLAMAGESFRRKREGRRPGR